MKAIRIVLVLIALGAAFLGGFIYAHRQQAGAAKGGRKILYYVDAMHPWYKSDKP
jgi:Cu(I)/Ag(I) efflux system membrane fusion protein